MPTTITEQNENILQKGGQKIIWNWESDTNGGVESQTDHFYNGIPVQISFYPDSDTGLTPETLYDAYILDKDGVDIIGGNGMNLSSTGMVYKHTRNGVGLAVYTKLMLAIDHAGASKKGVVTLFLAGE